MPTDGTSAPTYQVTVTGTAPMWFYCAQTGHCKSGMVFAINPPTSGDKTFQAYKNIAMGVTTVIATSTAATTLSVTAPPPTIVPGYNVGDNGQCECVCNLDQANG